MRLSVEFFAKSAQSDGWPSSTVAYSEYSLAGTEKLAKSTLELTFTWAERFEISDPNGQVLYRWPEEDDA
jgi:hypothetical protein